MPRSNASRSIYSEDGLAERVAYERDRRGWTYEGLAKRMTEAGCPINQSAIYKIERAQPRRRISVDELVAFATVFDAHVADLLTPPGVMEDERAKELLADLREALFDVQVKLKYAAFARHRLIEHIEANPETKDYVTHQLAEDWFGDQPPLVRDTLRKVVKGKLNG